MRKYLVKCLLIDDFDNIPEGILVIGKTIGDNLLYEIWDELINLDSGLLDFEYEHQYNQMHCYLDSAGAPIVTKKCVKLRYVSGKLDIINLTGYGSFEEFLSLINDDMIEILYVRIPNLYDKLCSTEKKSDFEISYNENELIEHHVSQKIYKLVCNNNNNTKDMAPKTYVHYVALVNKLVKAHFIRLYSKIRVNKYTMVYLKNEGWNLMRLDQLDELVELYLLDENVMRPDHIYFYKGNECLSMPNKTVVKKKDMLLSGNLGKGSYI